MMRRLFLRLAALSVLALVAPGVAIAETPASVKGTFVVGGKDAKLTHVRAKRIALDDGAKGYAVLASARPAEGDIEEWRSAEPSKKGSYLHVIFEEKGAIWVADLGHEASKTGHFGVVTEIETVSFAVEGNRLKAHIKTPGEQFFTEDHYTVDLTFDVTLE